MFVQADDIRTGAAVAIRARRTIFLIMENSPVLTGDVQLSIQEYAGRRRIVAN
jgi:hypothetical protein